MRKERLQGVDIDSSSGLAILDHPCIVVALNQGCATFSGMFLFVQLLEAKIDNYAPNHW